MYKKEIKVPCGEGFLTGDLTIPDQAIGLVIFSHGSGSSRFSPRNQYVASLFNQEKMATLLIDLLTPQEDEIDNTTREYRFDIPRLTERLLLITEWIRKKSLKIAYIGSSTGAASALIAASKKGEEITSVVSRGGRVDLAGAALAHVSSPTLFIVGGADTVVLDLNKQALKALNCEKKLEIIPHATHLFEEEGALEAAAHLAAQWLKSHF